MDRKDLDRFYADNVRLIHTVARKGYGRLQQIGASTDYDDLFQELTEVFIKSFDLFDESCGYQFSSYFVRAAYNKINRIAEGFEVERIDLGIRSIEELSDNTEDGLDLEERIAGNAPTPDEIYEANETANALFSQLSPVAAMVVGMAIDPPCFIETEFEAAVAHAEYARSQGVERRARGSINTSFICNVLEKTTNLTRSDLSKARREIAALAERIV